MIRPILLLFCLLTALALQSQDREADSLKHFLKTAAGDTGKVNALNMLAAKFMYQDPDTALLLSTQALVLAEKIKFVAGIGKSNHRLGVFHYLQGDYRSALDHYLKAIAAWDELEKTVPLSQLSYIRTLQSKTTGNIGLVYRNQYNYPKALDYYFKAEKIYEDLGMKYDISANLGNIGVVYEMQKDYSRALDYYFKAIAIGKEIGDKNQVANMLGDIGITYEDQGMHQQALDYYTQSLKLYEENKNKSGMARQLISIGVVYEMQKHYAEALDYYKKALNENEALGNKNSITTILGNMGSLYAKTKKYPEAEAYFKRALALADSLHYLAAKEQFERNYSQLDSTCGDFKGALDHYKKHIIARDSITNEENTKKQTQLEMQYVFDKKQAADSIRNAEQVKQEELKHGQEIQQQRIYTYGGVIGFLLMLIVAGVSFNAYRQKQKANALITEQKAIVEEKQKEILDSIHYAKRIQQSLLPTERYIARVLDRAKR
jgi:tetratricopeptide (TPR) repeat protein